MSRVEAATGMDRLPWLEDEPTPRPAKRRGGLVLGAASAAILAIAATGLWLGARDADQGVPPAARQAQSIATLRLPPPLPAQQPEVVRIAPQPQVHLAPPPEVRPAPAREVRIAAPPAQKGAQRKTAQARPQPEQQTQAEIAKPIPPVVAAPAPAPAYVVPRPWPPRVTRGAAGRLVEIGAFGSVTQAKFGWRYMVRAYPAMNRLPAVVRPDRNSKGRNFYRFRVGTTSQAHSEVLCQRMRRIGLSCAVVGLPWKAKVER